MDEVNTPIFEAEIYNAPNYKRPSPSTYWILIGALICALSYLLFEMGYPKFLWAGLVGASFISFARWADYKQKPIAGKATGSLTITPDTIKINDQKFRLDELNDITIAFESYYKKKIPNAWSMFFLRSGTENYLSFRENDKLHKYHFMQWGPAAQQQLLKVLEKIYQNGVPIKEYMDGRTYLGESLSYEEIQIFKSKYNLKMSD